MAKIGTKNQNKTHENNKMTTQKSQITIHNQNKNKSNHSQTKFQPKMEEMKTDDTRIITKQSGKNIVKKTKIVCK